MTDKNDKPEILDEEALNDVAGGFTTEEIKTPPIGMKDKDSFDTVTDLRRPSLTGGKDDVLIQNIGFPDTGKSIKSK